MELRIPTLEQLRTVYDRDLRTAFPAAELKPLKNMEEMWAEGRYRPWCLFDGDDIAGEAFLWLGHPGRPPERRPGLRDPGEAPGGGAGQCDLRRE